MARKITEIRQTTGQKINGVSLNVGKGIARFGMNYTMVFANIAAVALMTLVSIGFQGWSYLWTSTFIVTTVILFFIYITTHWSVHNLRLKRLRDYIENIEYIEKVEDDIALVTNTIEWIEYGSYFLSYRAVEKKKEAWKIYVQNLLLKLDKKYSRWYHKKAFEIDRKIITEYEMKHLTEEEIEKRKREIEIEKSKNRYTLLKEKYNEQLTDDWIARNLDKIHIDYDDVDRQFIENGATYRKQKKSKSEASYAKDNWQSRFVALFMSGFITAFSVDLAFGFKDLQTWIIFVIRIINLFLNVIMGRDYGEQFYMAFDIHNLNSRKSIATKEFKAWALAKGVLKVRTANETT